jgi:hypothetical protein
MFFAVALKISQCGFAGIPRLSGSCSPFGTLHLRYGLARSGDLSDGVMVDAVESVALFARHICETRTIVKASRSGPILDLGSAWRPESAACSTPLIQ